MAEFIFPTDDHPYYADEVGLSLAGVVRRETDGTPRVGMLAVGPDVEAVPASWKVQVGAFTHVHHVSGSVRFTGQSAPAQVDITAATGIPAGQARIDLVVWDLDERELFVIEGTPATSPTPPVYGEMVPVAEVRVNSGDGMVIQGQVKPVYEMTALAGGGRSEVGIVPTAHIPGNSTTITNVVFPSGAFTEPPVVVTGILADVAEGLQATVTNVTANGFTLRRSVSPVRPGGYAFGVSWHAVQP